ncbi:hypothetical protein LKL35_08605 [Streptomyces sp. ET3-23]|uniref:hypothetical protein n=1 Tax=Streptomyces sp. ET3-23 TaxID=2885643 RepID=UPI001D12719E|nr:hypothetical protein [Streptomyces sp. ET3-23]MCC2275482.1 hypothetical protein [Streptomyces sp. ET3-23]
MSHLVNVVQFPHPGGEHDPGDAEVMPWNSADHRRKFLQRPGRWSDPQGTVREGKVTFWGEWEAPSRIVGRWPAQGDLPRFLHEPLLSEMPSSGYAQNTDPLVFGPRFRYSNCKQFDRHRGHPTGMQDLTPGSVILFGSKQPGRTAFALDTVFVVANSQPYALRDGDSLAAEPFVQRTVVAPLRTGPGWEHLAFTLFDGATHVDPVAGMFSFVPCMSVDREPLRFARPVIDLAGFINPKSQQSPSGYTERHRVSLQTAGDAWRAVVAQVFASGCMLGHSLTEPELLAPGAAKTADDGEAAARNPRQRRTC